VKSWYSSINPKLVENLFHTFSRVHPENPVLLEQKVKSDFKGWKVYLDPRATKENLAHRDLMDPKEIEGGTECLDFQVRTALLDCLDPLGLLEKTEKMGVKAKR